MARSTGPFQIVCSAMQEAALRTTLRPAEPHEASVDHNHCRRVNHRSASVVHDFEARPMGSRKPKNVYLPGVISGLADLVEAGDGAAGDSGEVEFAGLVLAEGGKIVGGGRQE
jgi:hypothetical protein